MGYVVLTDFTDSKYGSHVYKVDDVYPCEGYQPSQERIMELSGSKNRLRQPLIAECEDTDAEEAVEEAEAADETNESAPTDSAAAENLPTKPISGKGKK